MVCKLGGETTLTEKEIFNTCTGISIGHAVTPTDITIKGQMSRHFLDGLTAQG